jgi:hypothetical protein|tara:strand:- start:406 stop:537 length:132 start_codon:yes stop_codon:yes gene_type:complete
MELTDVMTDRKLDREIENYEIYLEKLADEKFMREVLEEIVELD